MLALNLKVWKPKYLLHDIEKPWLLLWFKLIGDKDPYQSVQRWHKTHRKHHTEYPGLWDLEEMILNWECSRYTKKQDQLTAIEKLEELHTQRRINYNTRAQLQARIAILGLSTLPRWFGAVCNKELQDRLKQYPDTAKIAIEYCNPRELTYDKEQNIIEIN